MTGFKHATSEQALLLDPLSAVVLPFEEISISVGKWEMVGELFFGKNYGLAILARKFRRLFLLSEQKEFVIKDMGQ